MSANPRVHILIPAYNRRHSLEQSLPALLAQRMADWKLTLIDNNSSDGTSNWVRATYPQELASGRFKLVTYDTTVPIIENWNRCIDHLEPCDYIKFVWSDDNLHADYLERATRILDEAPSDVVGFCSAIRYVSDQGAVVGERRYGPSTREFWASVLYRNRIGCPSSVLLRHDAYHALRFDESNRYCADMVYLLTPVAARSARFVFTDDALLDVTVATGTETNTLFGSELMQRNRAAFRRDILAMRFARSAWPALVNAGVTALERGFFGLRRFKASLQR
jgi:glycosyltransferase involved in cell wall biosynthesis